jgi:hypothetical protein
MVFLGTSVEVDRIFDSSLLFKTALTKFLGIFHLESVMPLYI